MAPQQFPGIDHLRAPKRDLGSEAGRVETVVAAILADVRDRGDAAVADYAARFDKADLTAFEVNRQDREAASRRSTRRRAPIPSLPLLMPHGSPRRSLPPFCR